MKIGGLNRQLHWPRMRERIESLGMFGEAGDVKTVGTTRDSQKTLERQSQRLDDSPWPFLLLTVPSRGFEVAKVATLRFWWRVTCLDRPLQNP